MTTIRWTSGTACDFFLSLFVLHHAGDFGMRPVSAAGVRQRLSQKSRETLEQVFSFSRVPLGWISLLPAPQDAGAALKAVADLAPASRLPLLALPPEISPGTIRILEGIAARGSWTTEERTEVIAHYGYGPKPTARGFDNLLNAWLNLGESGENYLTALQEYYTAFFAEEELRIRPTLESGLAEAQALAGKFSPSRLVEHLSRGVRLENPDSLTDLTLLPSWWVTPLAFLARPAHGKALMAFPVRSEVQAGAPAAEAPEMLVTALKSLGDPTRLRILRYLAAGPLSPSELARRLRLRPPTVIHHLRMLRFAGLVQVTVSDNLDKRYAARPEALQSIYTTLKEFLDSNG